MRALVQRVARASVLVDGDPIAAIGPGMLVLLGVARTDGEADAERIARRVDALRIFDDAAGVMNEPRGRREVLCVSQFTLYADTSTGNRPSYTAAAPAAQARPLYELVCDHLGAARGQFGARMLIELAADGPVSILLE